MIVKEQTVYTAVIRIGPVDGPSTFIFYKSDDDQQARMMAMDAARHMGGVLEYVLTEIWRPE